MWLRERLHNNPIKKNHVEELKSEHKRDEPKLDGEQRKTKTTTKLWQTKKCLFHSKLNRLNGKCKNTLWEYVGWDESRCEFMGI